MQSAQGFVKSSPELCTLIQSCPTLCNPMDCSAPGSSICGILQAKNTGVGCHFLLQGIFLTWGSNPRLLIARGFFTAEPQGKPPSITQRAAVAPTACAWRPACPPRSFTPGSSSSSHRLIHFLIYPSHVFWSLRLC